MTELVEDILLHCNTLRNISQHTLQCGLTCSCLDKQALSKVRKDGKMIYSQNRLNIVGLDGYSTEKSIVSGQNKDLTYYPGS